jgi:predicted transcriptional regulator
MKWTHHSLPETNVRSGKGSGAFHWGSFHQMESETARFLGSPLFSLTKPAGATYSLCAGDLEMNVAPDSDTNAAKADELLRLASEIVAAYVSNNPIPAADVPAMIKTVHSTLGGLAAAAPGEPSTAQKPVVPVKRSVTPEYIVCLEDGKKLKMLKRYLRSNYNMTPEEYRAKWGLPADYPMVAPNYAAQRSEFAKKIGLGRSPAPSGRRRRS